MSKGIIFNIEEFAVHDGPGIRKLVFFKGCPLHCTWCHNPEGISFEKELMVSKSIRRIAGDEYEAKDLANILLKGKDVLIGSGGGITISGGEPLAQPEFLFDLIDHLKPLNIAIETSGFSNSTVFKKMIEKVDLVFMDIKHTDPDTHKKYTGVSNNQILNNLKILCDAETPFYIRIPLIPGVNDTKVNMENTALLLKDAKKLLGVELLPYHKTAPAKYEMVNRTFNPGFDTDKEVNFWTEPFIANNIKVKIL